MSQSLSGAQRGLTKKCKHVRGQMKKNKETRSSLKAVMNFDHNSSKVEILELRYLIDIWRQQGMKKSNFYAKTISRIRL